MDKEILSKWLSAGYVDQASFIKQNGTPQGGLASPTLLVLTLRIGKQGDERRIKRKDKVNFIYADDFIITGDRRSIETKVKSLVESFCTAHLELSKKTKITHIDDGFDFQH